MDIQYKLQDILYQDENYTIHDPLSINWNNFLWVNGYFPHKVSSMDIIKPYLISFAYYGNGDYENIILLLNNIENPWDMVPETEIKIPKKIDLDEFILANQK